MSPPAPPAIVIHGGAGHRGPGDPASSGASDAARLLGVRRACEAGWALLARGASALDAVEAAVRLLEDDPLFNAGTGATLTAEGDVELDASVMDGETLRCGAVAVVKDVANPVSLARAVMERSGHVLLAGAGASAFAREVGIPACDNARLVTPAQRARWEAAQRSATTARAQAQPDEAGPERAGGSGGARILRPPGEKHTVGAAARDARGHLAAATSTGGMFLKRAGRVGDTPIIGAGTYADDALAAVSCTGHGERIIRLTLARHAADLVGRGASAMEAAREAVRLLGARLGGDGGLIVVGPAGAPGFAHDTEVMARAWASGDGVVSAAL